MARQFRVWQDMSCAQLLAPQPCSATSAIVTPFVSLKYGHKAFLECDVAQGNAATVTFTPLQANSGTSTQGATSATSSSTTLTFSATPARVAIGQNVQDLTTPGAIPAGATVVAIGATTVTLSVSASGVGSGDNILFTGGAKVLTSPAPIASNLDTSDPLAGGTGSDQFTFSQAVSFTTDAGLKNKSVIFEIDPNEVMDINNLAQFLPQGQATYYDHVGLMVSSSNASNLIAVRIKIILRQQQQNPFSIFI
jgi:hypothetical protein